MLVKAFAKLWFSCKFSRKQVTSGKKTLCIPFFDLMTDKEVESTIVGLNSERSDSIFSSASLDWSNILILTVGYFTVTQLLF